MLVENPILRGFHPDPSPVLARGVYYLAVSTFEWFPGVRIYRSQDLIHWTYTCSPLDSEDKMVLEGTMASDGVWAPHLSFDGERFYLLYTVVHGARRHPVMDVDNFLISASDITGPWSKPVYLNSSGFDPSLFHGEDGRKWVLNMEWDWRKVCWGEHPFTGILLQEYSPEKKRLIGEPKKIFPGSPIGSTEGPSLFQRDGYYYLCTAEGGTGFFHAATVARSRNLTGPYELHPDNPVLTSWDGGWEDTAGELAHRGTGPERLKKAGHATFLEAKDGSWYLAHLCARELGDTRCCPLGREAALERVVWRDGWPYLEGNKHPKDWVEVSGDGEPIPEPGRESKVYTFDTDAFWADFQTLRAAPEKVGVTTREQPGVLRIYGQESVFSRFRQGLVARRLTELHARAETVFRFAPDSFQQAAGLICRYDEDHQYYAHVTWDEQSGQTVARVLTVDHGQASLLGDTPVDGTEFCLGVVISGEQLQFYLLRHGEKVFLGKPLETKILSDDYADGFTGLFIGMAVQDLNDHSKYADFISFTYEASEQEEV